MSFSKFGATCLAKICAKKVENGEIELRRITEKVQVDNSVEEYIQQIKEDIKSTKKILKSKAQANISNSQEYSNISANFNSQIFQILKMTPISELDYII